MVVSHRRKVSLFRAASVSSAKAFTLFSMCAVSSRALSVVIAFSGCEVWGVFVRNTLEALAGESGGSRGKPRGITHPWSEVERAKRSGGLHKRSAEAWGHGLPPRGAAPLSFLTWSTFSDMDVRSCFA